MPRLRTAFSLLCVFPIFLAAGSAARAADAPQPIDVFVKDAAGTAIAAAQVTVTVEKGAAWTGTGSTDASGRLPLVLPDLERVYHLRVTRDGYADVEHSVDLHGHKTRLGQPLTLAVTMEPMGAPDWFNRGVAALRANDLDGAAQAFRKAVETDPQFERGWSVGAMVAAEQKRWPDALDGAEHALAIQADDAQALRTRYDAMTALGRDTDAAAALDALVAHTSGNDTARLAFNAGAVAANQGHLDEARKRFGQALALTPTLWQAHAALAELSVRDKKYEDAVAELDKALAAQPKNVGLLQRKVEVLEALGDAARVASAQKALADAKGSG